MTSEQINQRIAEACGWKMCCQEAIDGNWRTKDKWVAAPDGTSQLRHDIPDYHCDLNEMREAENTLSAEDQDVFAARLADVCGITEMDRDNWSEAEDFILLHATAPQRAEAFLRTLGEWEES
jgi:hypothetical protein